jgi:flagellar biosynthesis/type III secretory pathway protein FliH
MFKHEYNVFKKEDEVAKSMTMLEQYMADGRAEGLQKGRQIGLHEGRQEAVSEYNRKIENMLRKRLQRKEPLSSIIDFANDLDFNLDRLNELINEAGAV